MSNEVTTSMLGTDKIAEALCKAQAAIKGAEKSHSNPAFKSKYATLADIWDACREPLTKNGLAVAQLVSSTADGVCVETRLLHTSGQSLTSSLVMPLVQRTPQAIGSAITYGRRYGLAAMVGVCPDEDDDGQAASQGQRREEPRREQPREPARYEKALDAKLFAAVKAVTGYLPEQTVASLRKAAGVPAVPAKLTYDQKQIMLRSLQQKLKTLEDVETPDDVDDLERSGSGSGS